MQDNTSYKKYCNLSAPHDLPLSQKKTLMLCQFHQRKVVQQVSLASVTAKSAQQVNEKNGTVMKLHDIA